MDTKVKPVIGQKVKALIIRGAEDRNGDIGEVTRISAHEFLMRGKHGNWSISTESDCWTPWYEGEDAIGKRVVVLKCSPQRVVGARGVITDLFTGETDDEPAVYVKLDPEFEQGPHSDGRWVITGWQFLHEDASHGETVDPKDARIAELESLLSKEQERLREAQRFYSTDLTTINRMANEAADEQEWCSTYEDTLYSMNHRLIGGFTLVGREKEFCVDAVEVVTVRVTRSWTGMARDADAAREAAASWFEDNDLTDDDVIEALREYADPEHHEYSRQYDWTVEAI